MNDTGSARDGADATGAADEATWHVVPLALSLSTALWAIIGLATTLGLKYF